MEQDGVTGFNSCGVYYRMIDYKIKYIEYLKSLIIEIQNNKTNKL